MADISRYKGGAARKAGASPRKQRAPIAAAGQSGRAEERQRDARAANPVNAPEQNQNAAETRRRTLNLDTSSFQEQFPISNPDEPRRPPRLGATVGGTEVGIDDERVSVRRSFKAGGEIKPPRGPMVTYGENGRPIKTTGEELTRRGGKSRRS
jgi:hypothetical protein